MAKISNLLPLIQWARYANNVVLVSDAGIIDCEFVDLSHFLKESPDALDNLGINKVMVCRVNQWQPGQWVTIYTSVGNNWIKSGTSYDPKFELTSGL